MKKILLSVSILTAIVATAQEDKMDTVMVEGKFLSLPYHQVNENVEIITKNDIESSSARSLSDLLQYYTGMDIRRRGLGDMQADVSIRGGSFEQTLLLINGVRMTDSQTGHNMMNLPFAMTSIEKIEIIKGPAARRYGQNAYAGVMNIITKTALKNEYRVYATAGDFSTWSLGAASDFGDERFSNLIQVNNSQSEGYRYNTDFKNQNIWYQNQLKINNGSLKLQAGFAEKKFGANGFYATPAATDQYEETQTSLVSLLFQKRLNKLNVHTNLYWRRAQDMYLYNRYKPELYRNMHIGNNFGGELNLSYTSDLGITDFGIDVHQENLRSNNLGKRDRLVKQVFLEHKFSLLNDQLQIIPGISWADFATSGNYFYPGLDLGYNIDSKIKFYFNIARVNRIPTYTDLYYTSRTEMGNPNLRAENAVSYELGYRLQEHNYGLKASAFARDSQNTIDWTKQNSGDKWAPVNLTNVHTKGIELEASATLFDIVKASSSYTYIDNKYAKTNQPFSRFVLENLKHQFISKVMIDLKPFNIDLNYRYTERLNQESYNLLDAKLNYVGKRLDMYLLVNNITNVSYTEVNLVRMPGRYFQLGFTFKGSF